MSCEGTAIGNPFAGSRMFCVEHQDAGLGLRLRAQGNVHRHLVAVEVRVERRAYQGWT